MRDKKAPGGEAGGKEKRMKKTVRSIGSIIYIAFLVNCQAGSVIEAVQSIPETVEIEDEQILEDHVNDFEVLPIEEYQRYFVQDNGIYGIPESAKLSSDLVPLQTVVIIDDQAVAIPFQDFSALNGVVYFSVGFQFPPEVEGEEPVEIVKYCKQSGEKITYIPEKDFPAVPEAVPIEMEEGAFRIENAIYDGFDISAVYKNELKVTYLPVTAFFLTANGLFYNVGESYPNRPEGLYFWDYEINGPTHLGRIGRMF